MFLDVHHHHKDGRFGIYNLSKGESPPDSPFSVGIHPMWETEDQDWFQACLHHPYCVAVGEVGLDRRSKVPRDKQARRLIWQAKKAREANLPLILHMVGGWGEMIKLLHPFEDLVRLVHGFHRKAELAHQLIRRGYLLGFGSALWKSITLPQWFADFPIDQFFLETDTSEIPIDEVYEKAASLRSQPIFELEAHLESQARIYFPKLFSSNG